MPKVRIYTDYKISKNVEINISKSQYHYLVNVMRKKDGDKICIFNEVSGEWEALMKKKKNLKIVPLEKFRKTISEPDIWICFSLIKPRNINYLVEKISELGVSRIIPLRTDFSLKTKIDTNRLRKIAIESVEQSNGLMVPKIEEVSRFQDILLNWDQSRFIFFCDEKTKKTFFDIEDKHYGKKKYAIFLGPVGGWSSNDRKFIHKVDNFSSVSLGNRLLKADTAGICALSSLKLILNS